jgi:hypothetical protein
MLFVTLCKQRAGTTKERVARRAQWQYPAGMNVVGEYWLQTTDPVVIVIAEADTVAPIMAAMADWDDVFEMTVVPAVSAAQGLELTKQMLAGAQR